MDDKIFESIRLLSRDDLEACLLRAAVHIREGRKEMESGRLFAALLIGFLLGAVIASAGFVAGSSLG